MIIYTSKNNQRRSIPDLTGQSFGRLTVLEYVGRSDHKRPDHLWLCRCECGAERPILFRSLKRGLATSCGCLRREAQRLIGPAHPHYRGGKSHDANGYVTLTSKEHGERLQMREHRVVMEQHLGRKLRRDEIVHHRNEDKSDNRIENLEVMTRAQHAKHHHGR